MTKTVVFRNNKSGEFIIKGSRKGGTDSVQVGGRNEKTGRWVKESVALTKGTSLRVEVVPGKAVKFRVASLPPRYVRDAKSGKFVSAGTTKDGVEILRPRG